MTKKFYFSIVVFIAWCLFATLFYKTLCVMLLCWIWRKDLDENHFILVNRRSGIIWFLKRRMELRPHY